MNAILLILLFTCKTNGEEAEESTFCILSEFEGINQAFNGSQKFDDRNKWIY